MAYDSPEIPGSQTSWPEPLLRVTLELLGAAIVLESNCNVNFPRLVLRRVEHPALVVLVEASLQVGRVLQPM